jgi:hypothetical protein
MSHGVDDVSRPSQQITPHKHKGKQGDVKALAEPIGRSGNQVMPLFTFGSPTLSPVTLIRQPTPTC